MECTSSSQPVNRLCRQCGIEKPESNEFFEPRAENGNFRGTCRVCRNGRTRNPETAKAKRARRWKKHKVRLMADNLERRRSKPKIPKTVKQVISCSECPSNGPFNYRKTKCDGCYKLRKRAKDSKNSKRRLQTDPAYRVRRYVGNAIRRALKNSGSKKLSSFTKSLPYSMKELVAHIESLWEPWMDWSNHGSPSLGQRMWHIDHIIPQSKFTFLTMSEPAFLECWKLENLRPMEAFANMRKLNRF